MLVALELGMRVFLVNLKERARVMNVADDCLTMSNSSEAMETSADLWTR
jgi:hypothetical protein